LLDAAARLQFAGTGTDRRILSSWTTSQMRFVEIDKVIVLPKALHQPVGVDVGGSSTRRVIEAIY
jgi:hypothetical protein